MSDEADRIERVKAALFAATDEGESVPDGDLLQSWQRSHAALGDPDKVTDVPQVNEELLDEQVLNLFRAPLTRFSDSLLGTGLGLLLADARGRILHRWCGDRTAATHLDRIGTVRGAVLGEETVGTNGVGTVAVTGKSVQIKGGEHFAGFYRNAVCTGSPVRHPVSGRLLAVVTASCDLTPRSDLLRPLLASVTQQLEQHVLDVEHPAARRMFTAFLNASRNQADPVMAFGPQGLLMQNPPSARLSKADLERLHELATTVERDGTHTLELSGGLVSVAVSAVEERNSVLTVLEQQQVPARSYRTASPERLVGQSAGWLSALEEIGRRRRVGGPLVVAGEAGTGKVSAALGHPFRPEAKPHTLVDAAQRHVAGVEAWLRELADRLTGAMPVVVRGVQTLDPAAVDGMRAVIEAVDTPVVLTLAADDVPDAASFALKFDAPVVWLPPLRDRPTDIGPLWRYFGAEAGLIPRPDTLETLTAYRWPGNLKELRTVVGQLAASGRTGTVAPTDLPDGMHRSKTLTKIERLELDALRKALRDANGNRSRAAELLGLSRATVYRKMKAYRLQD